MSSTHKNKFNAADMPEIRHVRSALLKSLKLVKKTTRLDKISKAILPNIDWKKLSVDPSMADESTQVCINKLWDSLNQFRDSMSEQLEHILCSMSTTIENNARAAASSPVIFQSAATMAQKYHDRGNKSVKRQHPSTKATASRNVSPATPKSAPVKPVSPQKPTTKSTTKSSVKVTAPPSKLSKSSVKVAAPPAKPPKSHPKPADTIKQRPPFKAARRTPKHPAKSSSNSPHAPQSGEY